MDYNSGIKCATKVARTEALAEGRAEGIEEQNIKIAKEMLKKGFDVSVISEITKLSEDEIKKLNK